MSGMPSPLEKVLEELVELSSPNLHILCVTSRPEVDIRNALEPVSSRHLSLFATQEDERRSSLTMSHASFTRIQRWAGGERKRRIW
jgi:hypothetical protein